MRTQLLFLPEGHPSSDEGIDMEGAEEERDKSHPPEMDQMFAQGMSVASTTTL